MAAKAPRRALVYVRLSSYQGEADTTTSPERQEESCRAYAAAHGWEVVDVISDLDVSGSAKGLRLDRPGLLQVRARWAEADVLLFAKIDRLARNVLDWSKIREEADAHSVALVSVADGLDLTTAGGRFVATILSAFAEMEADMISTRTKEAIQYLVREGRHRGGAAPFGWTITPLPNGPGYRLALHPANSAILLAAVDAVLSGTPVTRVATDLAASGVPAPGKGGWSYAALRRLLGRPILRGMLMHDGQVVRGSDGLPIRPHDALVTDTVWFALQSALKDRSRVMTMTEEGGHPFVLARRLVFCAACGSRLHMVSQITDPPVPAVWSCSARKRTPAGLKCPGAVMSRRLLEEYLVSQVLDVCGDLEGVEITTEVRADNSIAETEDALDAAAALFREAEDDNEIARLTDLAKALRVRLRELQRRPVVREAAERHTGRTFREDWDTADDTGRASLLASVLGSVTVRKGKRGRRGLDHTRLDLLWRASPVEGLGRVEAGVTYRGPSVETDAALETYAHQEDADEMEDYVHPAGGSPM